MRCSRALLQLIPLCLLACSSLASAQQQTQSQNQQPPSDKPPPLQTIEPGSDVPATTIPPKGGTHIKEKKDGGMVQEVEVQAGPSHYYMKPNVPAGNAQQGTVETGNAVRAPQWKVLEFDFNRKRKEGEATTPGDKPGAAPVPPPPPLDEKK